MAAQSIVEATRRTHATADAAVTLTAQSQAQAAGQADSESQIASTPQEYAERQVSRLPRLCSLHTALPMCRCEKMHQRARLSHCSWLQDEPDGLASTAQTAGRCGDGLHISVRFAQQREAVLQERIVELTGARRCITILPASCCVMLTLASEPQAVSALHTEEAARGTDVAAALRRQVRGLLEAAQDSALTLGALQVINATRCIATARRLQMVCSMHMKGMHMLRPASGDEVCISYQAELYSTKRQLKEAQQAGKAAHTRLASAQAAAADFERSFLAERQQRRKVSPCCACHRSQRNCMNVDVQVQCMWSARSVLTNATSLGRCMSSCSCCAATSECWQGCGHAQALMQPPWSARSPARWRCTAGQTSGRRPSSSLQPSVLRRHK